MAVVNAETIKMIGASFKQLAFRGLAIKSQWGSVAMEIKSAGSQNVYGFMSKFPKMRLWAGERVVDELSKSGYAIVNQHYESTVSVSRDDIEDDNLGQYAPLIEMAGASANEHVDELVFGLLKDGFETDCFDGKHFFASDHPIYPNENGTGEASDASNILNPAVATGPAWFLLDASRPLKPLIYQNRKPATFVAQTSQTDESVFMTNTYRFGIDARRSAGYGLWQLAVACRDELTAANFKAAYAMLEGMRTDGNRPLPVRASVLVVPTELRADAEGIINKQFLSGGESNTEYKRVDIVVTPFCYLAPESEG